MKIFKIALFLVNITEKQGKVNGSEILDNGSIGSLHYSSTCQLFQLLACTEAEPLTQDLVYINSALSQTLLRIMAVMSTTQVRDSARRKDAAWRAYGA